MNARIIQVRTDALAAEFIYTKKLNSIKIVSTLSSALTVLLPILFSAALLIYKGTPNEPFVNTISIILSAVLLVITIATFILELERKKENYLIGRRLNIAVANDALKLLDKNTGEQELSWFFEYIREMDAKDLENTGGVGSSLKKEAYRSALERLYPGSNNTVCSVCKASPFTFKKGACQLCGNTPGKTV